MNNKENMLKKYGSQEALNEYMRSLQALSPGNKNKPETAGFAKLKREDPERLKKIQQEGGRLGGLKRRAKIKEVDSE